MSHYTFFMSLQREEQNCICVAESIDREQGNTLLEPDRGSGDGSPAPPAGRHGRRQQTCRRGHQSCRARRREKCSTETPARTPANCTVHASRNRCTELSYRALLEHQPQRCAF